MKARSWNCENSFKVMLALETSKFILWVEVDTWILSLKGASIYSIPT